MKRRKLFYALTLCLLILVLGSIPVYAKKDVATHQEITMYAGKSSALKIDGNSKNATWTSSKKSVATVSKKGIVKAKKPGKCIIKAVLKKKTFIFYLTVVNKKSGNTPAVFDSNDISVKLEVQYWTKKSPEANDTFGCLRAIDEKGKCFSNLIVFRERWKIDTEYNSKNNTHTIKIGFLMKKWAPDDRRGMTYAPCYFAWECYNSSNQLVKSGVYSTGRLQILKMARGPLVISDLKEDSYKVKISNYYKK